MAVHLGHQMGKQDPPWSCLPWECESEHHPRDTQLPGKLVSFLCWFANNIYFPLLLKISCEKLQVAKKN